jgi:acid phosphatase
MCKHLDRMDSIQNSFVWLSTIFSAILLGTSLADPVSATPFPHELKDSIKYVVILFPENRSFDSLFGKFPGANGIREAGASAKLQLKPAGEPFDPLPQPNTGGIPGIDKGPDPRFPTSLKDTPYDISRYVPEYSRQGDLVHRFYTEQYQINSKESRFAADPKNAGGGPMSKFAAWSDNPGLVTSYLNRHDLPEGRLARNYVLCDNAFHSAFGGSFLNHIWLIAARSPIWPAHPSEGSSPKPANATRLEDQGFPAIDGVSLSDKALTNDPKLPGFPMSNAAQVLGEGDYWAINTLLPLRGPAGGYQALTPAPLPRIQAAPAPAPTKEVPVEARLPMQEFDTIGDRLTGAGIKWAWYSGGWDNAKAGRANYLFQFHHQPFTYFAKYALIKSPGSNPITPGEDSPGSKEHLKDADSDLFKDLDSENPPRVAFVKPIGQDNEHPGYSTVDDGQYWVYETVGRIQRSSIWDHCVIFIMYDEHGGLWDHVAPPTIDEWGPGARVPLTVISPFAKNGFVDHNQYETVSLLAFIERLFDLRPLNTRDANAGVPISPFKGQPDLIVTGTVGRSLKYALPAYNQPTSFHMSGVANGLSLDPQSGWLTGVPKQPGSCRLNLKVEGKDGPISYAVRVDSLPEN